MFAELQTFYVKWNIWIFLWLWYLFRSGEWRPASPPDERDLGASVDIVIRPSISLPRNCVHKHYFDNYYKLVDSLAYLAKQGNYSLETVRRNRIPSSNMPSEKEVKGKGRGTSDAVVASVNGIDVSCDNITRQSVGNAYVKDHKAVTQLRGWKAWQEREDSC